MERYSKRWLIKYFEGNQKVDTSHLADCHLKIFMFLISNLSANEILQILDEGANWSSSKHKPIDNQSSVLAFSIILSIFL